MRACPHLTLRLPPSHPQVGCGAGNSVFPLLELNPRATLYACDFAPSAVEVVCSHPAYEAAAATLRLHAFVADITGGGCWAVEWLPCRVSWVQQR